MTLIGIITLTSENTYDEKVAEYNRDVAVWSNDTENIIKNTEAILSSGLSTIELRRTEIAMSNIMKTKDTAITAVNSIQFISDTKINMQVDREAAVKVGTNTPSALTVHGIPQTYFDRTKYVCTTMSLSSDKTQFIRSSLGGCKYTSGGVWTDDVVGINSTTNLGYTTPVRVLADNDPAIILQRITKGSDSFGLTAAEQRQLGIILLVIGLFLCCVTYGTIFCIYRLAKGDDKKNQAFQQAVPVPYMWPQYHQPQTYQQPYQQPYQQHQQPYQQHQQPYQQQPYQQPPAYPIQQTAYPTAYPQQSTGYPQKPGSEYRPDVV